MSKDTGRLTGSWTSEWDGDHPKTVKCVYNGTEYEFPIALVPPKKDANGKWIVRVYGWLHGLEYAVEYGLPPLDGLYESWKDKLPPDSLYDVVRVGYCYCIDKVGMRLVCDSLK